MESESNDYEDINTVANNAYEGIERNHAIVRRLANDSKFKEHAEEKHCKKKLIQIVAIGGLVLLIAAIAAGTAYAVNKVSKLKSEIASSDKAELQQNTSFSSMLRNLEMKIQKLHDFSNSTAEMITNLDAKVLICTQNATQQNFAQNRQLNDSIFALNSIVGRPLNSCGTLPTSSPSGEYIFRSSNGSLFLHNCPPVTTRCGRRGRWRLLANLDMTNSTHQCYSNLTQHTYSNRSLCVKSSNSSGCSSVLLSLPTAYRSICGRIRAYQFGRPDAFHSSFSIDSPYVEGVSITHGSPRQHIWTFAAALNEYEKHFGCPCIDGGNDERPTFVKNDYFCDTGGTNTSERVFYGDNPLWDGAGCGPTNNCCSFNNPPWFYRELLQYTYDDVELRVCSDFNRDEEDIALERVEIYAN